MTDAAVAPALGRGCGTCSLCCKLMGVVELDKPSGSWCGHCRPGQGCGVYATRPPSCRDFLCTWLFRAEIGEEWKPSLSRMILVEDVPGNRIAVIVDPQRPDAWRVEPYRSQLRDWAASNAVGGRTVQVLIGAYVHVVFPDRAVDLGIVAPDECVETTIRATALGLVYEAKKVRADGPRVRLPTLHMGEAKS